MVDRTEELQEKLDGSEDADSIMMSILEVFTETEWVPEPGKYYTFLYIAKSPDITYDEHPFCLLYTSPSPRDQA